MARSTARVGTVGVEEAQVALGAPGEQLAQVQGVGLPGAPAVAGQEAGQGDHLRIGGAGVVQHEDVVSAMCGSFRSGAGPEPGRSAPSSGFHCRRYDAWQGRPDRRSMGTKQRIGSRTVPAFATARALAVARAQGVSAFTEGDIVSRAFYPGQGPL